VKHPVNTAGRPEQIRRRDFIAVAAIAAAGGAAVARAQQQLPVFGWLNSLSPWTKASNVAPFLDGLREQGFEDGRDFVMDYRWAEGHYDLLPDLAAELVRRHVTLIIAGGGDMPVHAAMAATSTIPIVFSIGSDPVAAGFVPNLNHPGGNVTGATFFADQLTAKDIELAHDLLPAARAIALLVNSDNTDTPTIIADAERATKALGFSLEVVRARSEPELEAAIAAAAERHADALVVSGDPFLNAVAASRVTELALRHRLPALSSVRFFADAGGLASYGASSNENNRNAGNYAGRILKGAKPGDLPVVQATRFELVINLQTARALGLTVSHEMLLRANDVIG